MELPFDKKLDRFPGARMGVFGGAPKCKFQEAFDIAEAKDILWCSSCDLMIDQLQNSFPEWFELMRTCQSPLS